MLNEIDSNLVSSCNSYRELSARDVLFFNSNSNDKLVEAVYKTNMTNARTLYSEKGRFLSGCNIIAASCGLNTKDKASVDVRLEAGLNWGGSEGVQGSYETSVGYTSSSGNTISGSLGRTTSGDTNLKATGSLKDKSGNQYTGSAGRSTVDDVKKLEIAASYKDRLGNQVGVQVEQNSNGQGGVKFLGQYNSSNNDSSKDKK